MRCYIVSDEVGDWTDHWAQQEGKGGFQDKAAELKRSEIQKIEQVQRWLDYERKRAQCEGITMAIEQLEALRAAHEDE